MTKNYVENVPGFEFDSSIDPPYLAEDRVQYEFTLILRLYLEQLNPPNGKRVFQAPDFNGTSWPALAWNEAAWHHFKDRFAQLVLQVWDKAFVLIPPAGCNAFVWPEGGRRRNLLCRFRLKLQDSSKGAHAAMQIVRLATPSKSAFRSHSSLLSTEDITLRRQRYHPAGASFLHNTPAHEIGHLLALWHVGEGSTQCTEYSGACYGTNLNERMNVMGTGSMLDLANARPWQHRAPFHAQSTKMADWKADWASSEAALRGLDGLQVDEDRKVPKQPVKPGLIDL